MERLNNTSRSGTMADSDDELIFPMEIHEGVSDLLKITVVHPDSWNLELPCHEAPIPRCSNDQDLCRPTAGGAAYTSTKSRLVGLTEKKRGAKLNGAKADVRADCAA